MAEFPVYGVITGAVSAEALAAALETLNTQAQTCFGGAAWPATALMVESYGVQVTGPYHTIEKSPRGIGDATLRNLGTAARVGHVVCIRAHHASSVITIEGASTGNGRIETLGKKSMECTRDDCMFLMRMSDNETNGVWFELGRHYTGTSGMETWATALGIAPASNPTFTGTITGAIEVLSSVLKIGPSSGNRLEAITSGISKYTTGSTEGTLALQAGGGATTVGGNLTVTGTFTAGSLDADTLDGKAAGNSAGQIPVSNATKCTNLNADLLDGYSSGNGSGAIPISNGTVCTNLNADKLDGRHAGTGTTEIPISTGTVCTDLNSDMVDGLHAAQIPGLIGSAHYYTVSNENGTTADWVTRKQWTARSDPLSIISITSSSDALLDRFTLGPGLYEFEAWSICKSVGDTQLRLRRVDTGPSTELVGQYGISASTSGDTLILNVRGRIQIMSGSETYELQHFTQIAAANGLGPACGTAPEALRRAEFVVLKLKEF
jgi:hypothetical protein